MLASGIFFPQREALRLDSQNVTPRARRKLAYAGTVSASHTCGARSLAELGEWQIKAVRVAEYTTQAGHEMKAEQRAHVEAYHQREAQRPLTTARTPPQGAPQNLPHAVVVEMDGGRIRTRDENSPRGVTHPHWREFQAGCAVRLQSEASLEDPRPEVPRLFLNRPAVHKLVSQLHRQRQASTEDDPHEESIGDLLAVAKLTTNAGGANLSAPDAARSVALTSDGTRPVRLLRTCVATLEGADACGRMLAAEAAERGFNAASRKGFVADGQACNWSVWECYFKSQGYLPIVDFIHLLSYVYALAMAVGRTADEGWQLHVQWVTLLWQGRAEEVLSCWRGLAAAHQVPEDEALPATDPRRPLQRGVTYLTNNLGRVDYPRYRRLGLPVTSTLMESLVKEFNHRVKGTEKFWNDPAGGEAILTTTAAVLSEDNRFDAFFARRPGCCFRRRSTLARIQQAKPAPMLAMAA